MWHWIWCSGYRPTRKKKIFIQGNSLIRKFYMCTVDVKLTLFQSFIAPMYTAHLWTRYSNNDILKLYRAYHNTLKMFLGLSKRDHTSPICVFLNVRSCPAVIRNFVFRFMVRLRNSSNSILQAILGTSVCYKSSIWNGSIGAPSYTPMYKSHRCSCF